MAQLILTNGKRLLETLNSVLDLSKIETNKIYFNYSDINLAGFIKEHVKLLDKIAKDNGLFLDTKIIDENVCASLDEQMLFQILNNLIGNAIKYTEKGGVKIEVNSFIKEYKKYASIKIIDTGIGIGSNDLVQIFEEFRQVSEGLNRKFEGTGLGLAITKRLVAMMSGEISLESKIGVGSTFQVIFPACSKEKSSNIDRIKDEEKTEKKFELTSLPEILMVENDFASREITRLFLINLCNITFVETSEAAVKLAKENKFQIILMDINLGTGLNGLETAKLIKKIEGYENIPIVALTAFAMAGEKEEFLKNGCTHYLSKPFHKKDIIDLLREIL